MRTDVEVLIVSFNSAADVATCLAALSAVMPGVAVAVREHGGDVSALAALRNYLADYSGPSRLDVDSSNPGFGAGCNALASTSTAAWLLFLNPDAAVASWPWKQGSSPMAGTITGPWLTGNGPPARHFGRTYRIIDEVARSWFRRSGQEPNGQGFVSGAALLVDRHSFALVGGFDERFFLFYEDIDFCLRANVAGITTHLDREWTVSHAGAHSTRGMFGRALAWSYESACRFHGERGSSLIAYRAYVLADAVGRSAWHVVRGRRDASKAYRRLASRVIDDLVHRVAEPNRR